MEHIHETPVEIRTPDMVVSELGTIAMTIIEPETESITFTDTSNCCEDCPDVNDRPPDVSECPYFDNKTYDWPVCTREGNGDDAINNFFFSGN